MFSKSTTIKNDLTMLNVTVVMIAMMFQVAFISIQEFLTSTYVDNKLEFFKSKIIDM